VVQASTGNAPWRLTWGDAALALAAAVAEIRDLLLRGSAGGVLVAARWANVSVWALTSGLLLFRRRFPVTVALVSIGADVVSFFPAAEAVALFTVGAHVRSPRRRTLVPVVSLAAHAAGTVIGHESTGAHIAVHWATVTLAPFLLGLYIATRQQLVLSLQEHARRIEYQKLLSEENARMGERRRIALEMHDVVAHGVTQMVIRAGALQVLAESRSQDWAAREAAALHATGRGVLDELRAALGILRTRNSDEAAESRAPLAGVTDLPRLIEAARESGTPVDYDRSGDLSLIDPHHARAVYRVVQESLTNIAKHAPRAPTRIELDSLPGLLTVRVRNATAPVPPAALPPGGHGLAGMRERVETLGGSLRAGPAPGGGFLVEARLPLLPADPPATIVEPAP
jgi:signal transduction histidine kinase